MHHLCDFKRETVTSRRLGGPGACPSVNFDPLNGWKCIRKFENVTFSWTFRLTLVKKIKRMDQVAQRGGRGSLSLLPLRLCGPCNFERISEVEPVAINLTWLENILRGSLSKLPPSRIALVPLFNFLISRGPSVFTGSVRPFIGSKAFWELHSR